MNFHPDKCNIMSVSNKKNPIEHNYKMENHILKRVDSVSYLGVQINRDMKWNGHVQSVAAKANRTLGFLRRNLGQCPQKVKEQAYISLVRPTLEYASSAWDPHHQSQIKILDQIQRRAARFVTNCHSTDKGCITSTLKNLKWESLEHRRKKQRLNLFHKITYPQIKTAPKVPNHYTKQPSRYNTRAHHTKRYAHPSQKTNVFGNSYYPHTIKDWNKLPEEIIEIEDHEKFKHYLDIYFNQ